MLSTESVTRRGEETSRTAHFVDLFSQEPSVIESMLDLATEMKEQGPKGLRAPKLPGRVLGLIFEKPSLRTRLSFESAMAHLGGSSIYANGKDVGLGTREPLQDVARITSQYVDAIAVRTYSHEIVEHLAAHAEVPVINALTDAAHPCQAMSDLLTIREELGTLNGIQIAFVGDGNNVARSLAVAAALSGAHLTLASPEGFDFPIEFRTRFETEFPGVELPVMHDPVEAVRGVDVVYTDVWCSMGQESEASTRLAQFKPFQVDRRLMNAASRDAIFLHCLPARRGEEVTAEVIDGSQSRVVAQAANRLHFQKALLLRLIGNE